MIGARILLDTLRLGHVDTVFANPGTSEMHFVAAMDETPGTRGILCLFEGVATGAADGYARVTGRPAATLLHLGPGFANGWANLHNARRARVPLINIVGDHATHHVAFDPPLHSDIASLANGVGWSRRTSDVRTLSRDSADAMEAAVGPPGRIATLVVPADVSWSQGDDSSLATPKFNHAMDPDVHVLTRAVDALRTKRCAIVLGGRIEAAHLQLAHQLAQATQSGLLVETFPTTMERGGGLPSPARVNYLSEFAQLQLKDFEVILPIGTTAPVAFFAYENLENDLLGPNTTVIAVAEPGVNTLDVLKSLVEALPTSSPAPVVSTPLAPVKSGVLDPQSLAQLIAWTMPEDLVVVDESNTSGLHLYDSLAHANRHQWLTLTGGAIGFGLPVGVGAAVAHDSRVLVLEADGSFMYTNQALWTMAREGLNVTVVALVNRSYSILQFERHRLGLIKEGEASRAMLSLDQPRIDYCELAHAQGVPSQRVKDTESLQRALENSYATPGPMLIEIELKRAF